MLLCFGFSWPAALIRSIRARTAKSTSLGFILLIMFGYLAGLTAKICSKQFSFVLIAYILNLCVVIMNLMVYIRNSRLDRTRERKSIAENPAEAAK